MKGMIRVVLAVVSLLGSAAISNAGPIINGSFETPDCDVLGACSNGSWGLFETIPGWTSPVGLIEIGESTLYGITGQDGDQVLELDSTGNSTVAQVVAGPGTYLLSFLYGDRAGGAVDTFEVYWNTLLVAAVVPVLNSGGGAMQLFTAPVIAIAGNNTLEFKATGLSDSLGALIDDVQLDAVPDGGLTALLLGVSIFGLRCVSRKGR